MRTPISNTPQPQVILPPRLRLRQAAAHLGISPRSLADRGWRLKHGIPTLKVGRAVVFDRAALDAWLRRHAERPLREIAPTEAEGGAV